MRRREFIAGLGSAVACAREGLAQEPSRVRKIGALMAFDEFDSESKVYVSGFTRNLAELGWTAGTSATIDFRWAAGDIDRARRLATELVDQQPDVILAHTSPLTAAVQRATQTIPIVFVIVTDPVGDNFVRSLPRPGANITGFVNHEAGMAGKWLQLIGQIAPDVRRVAFIFNPNTAPYARSYFLPTFETAAGQLLLDPIVAPIGSDAEIEAVVRSLGGRPRGGLVVCPDIFMFIRRASIIALAAQHNVPTIYWHRSMPRDGGLLSYGADTEDIFRRSASYVDRILRGAKPADLPVQLPTKFEMAVNLKAAKAQGLAVPPSILLAADEVIE
jgi:putative ABC transport system substrate-binding protein